MTCQHMDHAAFSLHLAAHCEQSGGDQLLALALGKIVPDDEIDVAGLVLERHEDHAARRGGTLAAGDEACCTDQLAVAAVRDLLRGADALPGQALPQ